MVSALTAIEQKFKKQIGREDGKPGNQENIAMWRQSTLSGTLIKKIA